jgi:hypothetical protein
MIAPSAMVEHFLAGVFYANTPDYATRELCHSVKARVAL